MKEEKREKVWIKWFDHKEGAEWLSMEICDEYKRKASELPPEGEDTGAWRVLRKELQELCDIPEIQAINIIRGQYCQEYVAFYENMRSNPELWYRWVYKDEIYD